MDDKEWPAAGTLGRTGLAATAAVGAALVVLLAPLPLAGLGALAFVASAASSPLPALGLIVVSLPFYLVGRPVGHYTFSPTELLIGLATLAGIVRALTPRLRALRRDQASRRPGARADDERTWSQHDPARWPSPVGSAAPDRAERRVGWVVIPGGDPAVNLLLGLFLVAAAVSLTASVAPHESLQSFRTIVVEPAVFYLLVVTQVRGRRAAVTLAVALILAGVLISVVGFWQEVTGDRIITAEAGLRRIRGFYGSPNNLGLFLGRALPMAVALALWSPRGRALLAGAAGIVGVALILTFSLGAWFAVGPSLLLVAALRGRRAFLAGVVTGGAALGIAALAALGIPRIGSHFDLAAGTSSIRLDVWQSALRMLADHPVRGIGLDNFLFYYQHGYRLPTAWQDPNLSHPHNLVLDFWLSLGLPGPLLLSGLLGRFGEIVVARWRTSAALERGVLAGATGALADTVLHGLVDNSFFLVDLAVLFWLMFAIVGVLSEADGSTSPSEVASA